MSVSKIHTEIKDEITNKTEHSFRKNKFQINKYLQKILL